MTYSYLQVINFVQELLMDSWLIPPIEKVYEALTAIADKRIEMTEDNLSAKLYSSSGNKFYTITYDPEAKAIMSNDNSAFYTDQISYPMIAFLMMRGDIDYDKNLLEPLSNIYWKEINQKHKNNYKKAVDEVLKDLKQKDVDTEWLVNEIEKIYEIVKELKLTKLGKKQFPSKAY